MADRFHRAYALGYYLTPLTGLRATHSVEVGKKRYRELLERRK